MQRDRACLKPLFALSPADQLSDLWDKHIHGCNGLAVFIQPHIEGLDTTASMIPSVMQKCMDSRMHAGNVFATEVGRCTILVVQQANLTLMSFG